MASSEEVTPLVDYVSKLLLLETIKSANKGDQESLDYLSGVLYDLTLSWNTIRRPRK